jgi:hypothetical protein
LRHWLLALALFTASAALFSLPALTNDPDVAVGTPQSDVFSSVWILWAVPEALGSSEVALGDFPLLVDPAGTSLWPHLGNVLYPLLMAPVTLVHGPITASNWGLILILFLNAFCAFVFLQYVVADPPAALAPALAFAMGSYVMAEAAYGNVELAGVFVLPLAGWAIVRACDKPTKVSAALVFATLVLAGLWNAYYGLAAFAFAVPAALWAAKTDRTWAPLAVTGAAVAAAFAVLAGPAYLLAGQVAASAPAAGWQVAGAQLDLLEPVFFARDYPGTVPWFLLALALGVTLTRHRSQTWFWWVSAAAFFVLALGATVHVLGQDTGVPGPYSLLSALPGMERARWPYRFAVMAQLCLAVIAAYAMRAIFEYMDTGGGRGERRFSALMVLVGLGVSFFLVPHPAVKIEPPSAYGALHEHGDGAVLELPASPDFHVNARNLVYQTVHGHPVLVAKPFPDSPLGFAPAATAAAPALATLAAEPFDPAALASVDQGGFAADLKNLGVRYVALHPADLDDVNRALLRAWLVETCGPPARNEGAAEIYVVR